MRIHSSTDQSSGTSDEPLHAQSPLVGSSWKRLLDGLSWKKKISLVAMLILVVSLIVGVVVFWTTSILVEQKIYQALEMEGGKYKRRQAV